MNFRRLRLFTSIAFIATVLAATMSAAGALAATPLSCQAPPQEVTRIFSDSFNDPEIYQRAECNVNIWRLLFKLRESGTDISDNARVLYIFRTSVAPEDLTQDSLTLLRPRNQKGSFGPFITPWYYHVILVAGPSVIDLDFGGRAQIVGVRDYFRRMFEISPDLYVREIPAADYMISYRIDDEAHDWRYYLYEAESAYPSVHASKFLNELPCPEPPSTGRRGH